MVTHRPATGKTRNASYTDVVRQIRALIQQPSRSHQFSLSVHPASATQPDVTDAFSAGAATFDQVRSSNLRLRKIDKDQFGHNSFDYVRRYIENSLAELQARNPSIQGTFRRVSDTRFEYHPLPE